MKPTLLCLIGKPLSGKDTQADLLVATHPEAVKISTGHVIRAVREEGETHRFWSILGPYIPYMEQGLKLPDKPVIDTLSLLVEEQVAEGKTLLVIAGSPRSFEQLEGFGHMAEKNGATLDVVHVDATDEETYRRSATRNEGRMDDTPQIHKIRLEEYETHVRPVVDWLRQEGRVTELDGMKPVNDVYAELDRHLAEVTKEYEPTLPAMARR